MTTRIYVPLTSTGLAALVAEDRISGPLQAHAVTAGLQEAWPDGDEEEWEYAALMAAADGSWSLRSSGDSARRHVLAVDVAATAVLPAHPRTDDSGDVTGVTLTHDVVWKSIAALHMDTEDHVEGDEDQELAWFARQEIRALG